MAISSISRRAFFGRIGGVLRGKEAQPLPHDSFSLGREGFSRIISQGFLLRVERGEELFIVAKEASAVIRRSEDRGDIEFYVNEASKEIIKGDKRIFTPYEGLLVAVSDVMDSGLKRRGFLQLMGGAAAALGVAAAMGGVSSSPVTSIFFPTGNPAFSRAAIVQEIYRKLQMESGWLLGEGSYLYETALRQGRFVEEFLAARNGINSKILADLTANPLIRAGMTEMEMMSVLGRTSIQYLTGFRSETVAITGRIAEEMKLLFLEEEAAKKREEERLAEQDAKRSDSPWIGFRQGFYGEEAVVHWGSRLNDDTGFDYSLPYQTNLF